VREVTVRRLGVAALWLVAAACAGPTAAPPRLGVTQQDIDARSPAVAADQDAVSGIVVDAEGRPRAKAFVWATSSRAGVRNSGLQTLFTDADGRFRVARFLPGEEVSFEVTDAGCAPSRAGPFALGTADVRILLAPERTLPGRVVDPQGAPVAGAEVRIGFAEMSHSPRTKTAADGTFTLHELDASSGELVVLIRDRGATGRAKFVARRSSVSAADGPVEVVLGAGLAIEGTVVDVKDRPLRHRGVLAMPLSRSDDDLYRDWPSAWTGDDGTFRVEGLDPGRFRLRSWYGDSGSGGGPPYELVGGDDVEAGATGVKLRLVIRRR
jgi:hypothetical protein